MPIFNDLGGASLLIKLIIIAAILAIIYLFIMWVGAPAIIMQVFWIIVIAAVVIIAIKFLMSL